MKNKLLLYKLLIVLVMIIIWFYLYPILPAEVPIHWGFNGQPNRMWSKFFHITIFPIISIIIIVIFAYLPKLDPKKENYNKFGTVWEIFQFSFLFLFLYIFIVANFITLNPEYNISRFMMSGVWVFFIVIWNFMWKIRQNYFVWIKVPWTLADEEVWNKTHRFGGKIFMLGWLLFLLNAFFLWQVVWVFIITFILIVFSPIVYSYIIFKKKKSLK